MQAVPKTRLHKGQTGNTILISQPSPSYEQVLPNTAALQEGLVVLFCKTTDDVSKAQVLVVNREEYRAMVQHRKQVCPVFATTAIDSAAIDNLPENAVPDILIQGATHMPEAINVKTTIHGPANRVPIFCRDRGEEGSDSGDENNSNDEKGHIQDSRNNPCGNDAPPAASNSGDDHSAVQRGDEKVTPAEELNEHEPIIAVDPESMPSSLRLF